MTFIFIGRSGSGKGTQAELLIKHLTQTQSAPVVYIETGRHFRDLINQPTYSSQLAKAVSEKGDRQPDFLADYLWSDFLIHKLKGGEHLVFDGTPRSLVQAQTLDTAMTFYGCGQPIVIFLDVSVEHAHARLVTRGRHDDHEEGIRKRLEWYERDVAPVIDYYRAHPNYQFVQIEAEQSIEVIHEEIKKFYLASQVA